MKKNIFYQAPDFFVMMVANDDILCQSPASAGATTESFETGEAIDFD